MEGSASSPPVTFTNTVSDQPLQEQFLMQTSGGINNECIFCDETFKHRGELWKHVVAQHRATLCEPNVLRVDSEYLGPQDKCTTRAVSSKTRSNKDLDCEVCFQEFNEAIDQETHMKKHKDSYIYCCDVCQRRYKAPHCLKKHKKTHTSNSRGKNKLQTCSEMPVTINNVEQEKVANNVTSPYKQCTVCGFMFPNKAALMEHIQIHDRNSASSGRSGENLACADNIKTIAETSKEECMNIFNLTPRASVAEEPEPSGKWISALDPVITYQAWQLATKGKVAVTQSLVKDIKCMTGESSFQFRDYKSSERPLNIMNDDVPINLSIKHDDDDDAITDIYSALAVSYCLDCSYKTLYPELLIMHQKLEHKPNENLMLKNGHAIKASVNEVKCLDCLPAQNGVDILPLLTNGPRVQVGIKRATCVPHRELKENCTKRAKNGMFSIESENKYSPLKQKNVNVLIREHFKRKRGTSLSKPRNMAPARNGIILDVHCTSRLVHITTKSAKYCEASSPKEVKKSAYHLSRRIPETKNQRA